jgi:hypothetical protein
MQGPVCPSECRHTISSVWFIADVYLLWEREEIRDAEEWRIIRAVHGGNVSYSQEEWRCVVLIILHFYRAQIFLEMKESSVSLRAFSLGAREIPPSAVLPGGDSRWMRDVTKGSLKNGNLGRGFNGMPDLKNRLFARSSVNQWGEYYSE